MESHTNMKQKFGKHTQTLTEEVETHTNINKKGRETETSAKQLQTNTNINLKGGKPIKHETKSSKHTHKH